MLAGVCSGGMKPIVNIAEVETFPSGHGDVFAARHGLLSRPLGGAQILEGGKT